MADEADEALEAIFQAAEGRPHHWVDRKLVAVSEDGRTVRLEPATRQGTELWTDRPWAAARKLAGRQVRFHELTGVLVIGEERRLVRKGTAPPLGRVRVSPLTAGDVQHVQMSEWVSGWFGADWMDDRVGGYARMSEGPCGQVVASLTLMLPEGFGSYDSCPATDCHLRFDPARNSVDYIVYVEGEGWSLERTVTVDEDFAVLLADSWPAEVFQRLIEACPSLDVHALSREQAQELGWLPCADDPNPPPLDHLWRPVGPD